jgi:hypothetical protein
MINEIEFLKWIIASDKSETYVYGEARKGDGKIPKKGERFLTPREMAELRLKELIEGIYIQCNEARE